MGGLQSPEKGWVRAAVLDSLSKSPSSLSSLAKQLGVSKSTIDYHLKGLLERGFIEITDSNVGRGGVVSKQYSLGKGSLVLLPTQTEEAEELRHLEESFGAQMLAWEASRVFPDGRELKLLLYSLLLHLFKVTRGQHGSLLTRYGQRAGSSIAKQVRVNGRRASLLEFLTWARSADVASGELVEISEPQSSALLLNQCLGSGEHPGRACWFLEGIIAGFVAAKLGPSYSVSRVDDPRIPSCCLVVTRGRAPDAKFLREAILSSPMRGPKKTSQGGRR